MKQILAIVGIALLAAAIVPWSARTVLASGTHYYINPDPAIGSDTNNGLSSTTPFKTIQKAVNMALPGDVINLASGVYPQDVKSYRHGTASSPITIQGPSSAVIKGAGNVRVIQITHDYITVDGFTVDGLFGNPNDVLGYRKKLLYAIGAQPLDGITGLKILRMTFKNAADECVRIRYFSQRNEIAYSTVIGCGIEDFRFNGGSKNGEAIYVGTANEQLGLNGAPTADIDQSNDNWIHHNTIDVRGAECVNIKEGSSGNVVEHNKCTGELDSISAGIEVRGNGNIIRDNEIYGNTGGGVKLFSDVTGNGINNQVYRNQIYENANGGIKIHNHPQGQICGNTMSNNTGGNLILPNGGQYNPTAPCSQTTATATNTPVPPTATNTPVPPTATNTSIPTATNTPIPPTATRTSTPSPTNTPVPPTATRTSTPSPTNTPVPPTATRTSTPSPTNTPVPPTATRTSTPTPTNTPVPPTPTRTSTPTPTGTPVVPTSTSSPTSLPATPSNLVATSRLRTEIEFSWSDNAGNETGFNIERSANGTSFSTIGTVGANISTFRNTNLVANTTYYYRVRAYNTAGNSSYSNVLRVTTARK